MESQEYLNDVEKDLVEASGCSRVRLPHSSFIGEGASMLESEFYQTKAGNEELERNPDLLKAPFDAVRMLQKKINLMQKFKSLDDPIHSLEAVERGDWRVQLIASGGQSTVFSVENGADFTYIIKTHAGKHKQFEQPYNKELLQVAQLKRELEGEFSCFADGAKINFSELLLASEDISVARVELGSTPMPEVVQPYAYPLFVKTEDCIRNLEKIHPELWSGVMTDLLNSYGIVRSINFIAVAEDHLIWVDPVVPRSNVDEVYKDLRRFPVPEDIVAEWGYQNVAEMQVNYTQASEVFNNLKSFYSGIKIDRNGLDNFLNYLRTILPGEAFKECEELARRYAWDANAVKQRIARQICINNKIRFRILSEDDMDFY